jgi:hypothetical protein
LGGNVQVAQWVVPSRSRRDAVEGGGEKRGESIRGSGQDRDSKVGEGLGEGVVIVGCALVIQGEKREYGDPS